MVRKMGIVVESDDKVVKVFSANFKIEIFKTSGLDRDLSVGVGSWLNWDPANGEMENRAPKFPSKLIDGVLHVETVACCANLRNLEPKNREKWENIVWSPFIGKIYDVNDDFVLLAGNELYDVTARYIGSDEEVMWEVVSCRMRSEDLDIQLLSTRAPWTLEQIVEEIGETSKRDPIDQRYDRNKALEKFRFCGVIVKRDKKGFFWIWGHSIGLYRVLKEESLAELGKWYSYSLRSKKSENFKYHGRKQDVFHNTVCNLLNTESRSETAQIDTDEYGVLTELKFNDEIKRKNFYWDFELGKVELPSSMITEILNTTNDHDCEWNNIRVVGIAKNIPPKEGEFLNATEWTFIAIQEIYNAEGIQIFSQEC